MHARALTCEVGIYFDQRLLSDLLLKEVLLVEEEDHGRVQEPLVVEDGVEQSQSLTHAVLGRADKIN